MSCFKTLIVEDNPGFRQMMMAILKGQFPRMVVEEAEDGEAALQRIEESLPNLVFMDIKLPGENGLQLTKSIKKRYPHTLLAILTSYDLPEYREAALGFGADFFLIKGTSTRREIVELIQSILIQLGFDPGGGSKRTEVPRTDN